METALSIWQATGQEVWACLSVSNIGSAPVHDYAEVIIARDGDAPGSKAEGQILRAASSLATRGLKVMMANPPEGQDFNDVLVNEGEGAVRSRLAGAAQVNPSQTETRPKNLAIGSEIEIAGRVRKDLNAKYGRVVHADGVFWRYCGSEWATIPNHTIRLPVHAYDGADFTTAAGGPSRVKLNESRVNSVLNQFAALCADPSFFDAPPTGINCASGFIRFDAKGVPRLESHNRDHRCAIPCPATGTRTARANCPQTRCSLVC
ncbi:MAG: toprim domain-containing protein [Pseudorhodobacter sp.]|nr:toprim domain-containing protein [Pseudorhodobacter sp.]